MPGSLNTVVQFLGRAMRLNSDDYPAEHRDRARLVFFVPCGGGAALADLSIEHSRHALLTCCFLADRKWARNGLCCVRFVVGSRRPLVPVTRILPRPMPRMKQMSRVIRGFARRA